MFAAGLMPGSILQVAEHLCARFLAPVVPLADFLAKAQNEN
jgi:hypothetical protein